MRRRAATPLGFKRNPTTLPRVASPTDSQVYRHLYRATKRLRPWKNRDENLARAAALPPRLTNLNGHAILAPSEPSGGTWFGVNDTGATLALINWYSITSRVAGQTVSRGEVVKLALPFDQPLTPSRADARRSVQ